MKERKTAPAKAAPDLEIWRRTLNVSDLFRIVAKKGAESERMSRITVNQARIFGYIFSRRGEDSGTPAGGAGAKAPEGVIRISKLAHDLDVTPAAAGQAVDRLVRAGMVDRRTDPTDRRAFVISISKKGRAHLNQYQRRCRELSDELLADVPPADVAAFDRVLSAVYHGLEAKWQEILAARDKSRSEA